MPEYTLHVPSIRGATTEAPNMPYEENDFPMDDLADIDDYYLLSTSGIPPEGFDDLDPETKTETIDMIHDLGECFPNDGLGD